MTNDSLDQALEIIIKAIEKSDISVYDKVELLININLFLKDYDNNIKVLKRGKNENSKRIL